MELRVENGMPLSAISAETGIAKSTLSLLLRAYPLSQEDIRKLPRKPLLNKRYTRPRGSAPSNPLLSLYNRNLTTNGKGAVAEAAILYRMTLLGVDVHKSIFDGVKSDFIVGLRSGRLVKVQVKLALASRVGAPFIRTVCSDISGQPRSYAHTEIDLMVGYVLDSDCAYVFSFSEVENRTTISVRDDACEAWHKLGDY